MAKEALGYRPHIGFEEGLKKTWEWFSADQGAASGR
jgi:nucleoside-diphosphate-sugar epimerase